MESICSRKKMLEQWLKESCALPQALLQPMHGDASFRRYFRVIDQKNSYVAMDADPLKENCAPFVAIAGALQKKGLDAPTIFHQDITNGFLLLTDFGNQTYLNTLNHQNADRLYQRALGHLAILQSCREVNGWQLPKFDAAFLWKEWSWFKEWFLQKFLQIDANANLDTTYEVLVHSACTQPQVFMHRDYHSANLMVLPDSVGILDFQDAFIGPITYDPVSLLRDCYIAWPDEKVKEWALYYWKLIQAPELPASKFLGWFDLMGVQRHLKALLTFARKHVRDHDSRYLSYMPQTLQYLLVVTSRYSTLSLLHDFLVQKVKPRLLEELQCVQ